MRSDVALRGYDQTFAAFEPGLGPADSRGGPGRDRLPRAGLGIETFGAGFDRPPEEYEPEYPNLAAALRETSGEDIDDLGFELGLAAVIAWISAREA